MRNMTMAPKASMLALAIALAAGPTPAAAQSFQGSVNSATGATVDQSTPGVTNVSVTQQQAVIEWTATNNPNDGTIVFQPDGTTANFFSGTDFAVLNRVTPGTAGSAIYMGGTINGFAGDFTGGTIFFYSPNGIIIGQNASINVGSLGLTTLPIGDDGQGNWMSGFGTATPQVTFGQATNPNSFVRTSAMIDGSINAFGAGSYVAMVAPIVEHSGIIRTDTAAALVAAEAATITFSPDGLFNIEVTVGTDVATGIDVDGGTIERRNAAEGIGNHYAYLVAVAKNDAVDMVIRNGGSVGFDTATSAAVEDNVVVLSGGGDVLNGTPIVPGNATAVNLDIDSSTFTTDVFADISGAADIRTSSGDTSFGLDPTSTSLTLFARADSIITANNGNTLSIAGDLFANLDSFGTGALTTGNVLRLSTISASTLTVGGDVFLSAQSFGAGNEGLDAGDAIGGTVIVQTSSGGTIDIAGGLDINVDGWGGEQSGFGAAGGDGTGGQAHILANGGSGASLTVGGPVTVSASGQGGTTVECSSCQVTGGTGTGGTILLQAFTGTGNVLALNGTVDLTASGQGGAGDVAGGSGVGGTIQFVSADGGSIAIADDLAAVATGSGGFGLNNDQDGGQGGSATGGNISTLFQGTAATIDLNGTSTFSADAFGGDGVFGGNATGGFVNLQASANGTLTAAFLGASADGFGGNGFTGGDGTGGRAWTQAITGADIVVQDLALSAEGFGGSGTAGRAGGSGATGGDGTGGLVVASADGAGASLTVANTLDLEAGASGGFGQTGSSLGGNALGGQADIFAANGALVTLNGFVSADTTGRGGNYFSDSSTGGNGTGGIIFFQANDGGTLDASGEVQLAADGIGGFSFGDCIQCGGTGGDGTGGTVTIQAFGGAATTLTVDGEVNATAIGFGSSGFAGPGGDGQGGTVRLGVHTGATANFMSSLFLNASGNGGWQTNGGLAGNGTGGLIDAFVNTSGGTLNVDGFADLNASGFGGNTDGSGGVAGDGIGGTARFLGLGGTANFDSDLIVRAEGIGGNAGLEIADGIGGDGTGNIARIHAAGGDINIGGTASVSASGFGGSGTTGGSGTGGGDFFSNSGGAHIFALNGDIVIGGAAIAMSDGFGADGSAGGDGGDGAGGWASIHAANGDGGPSSITVQGVEASAFASAIGVGGNGGDGLAGIDGTSAGTGTDGGAGGNGGDGGTGTGGVAAMTAAAGNGALNISVGFVDATGTGGAGGAGGNGGIGGNGDGGAGGNGGAGGTGGAGGDAFGGISSFGVEAGTGQAAGSNLGTGNFGFMEINATAQGGEGGAGGSGGAAGFGDPAGIAGLDGNGGAGGDAVGGIAELQARGGTVNVSSAVLIANAFAGNGGLGATDGAGGNAESDEAYVLVTNRPGNAALRGTLNAGSISANVHSIGGFGSTPGIGLMEGGSAFVVINGDATIGSVDFSITAAGQIADLAPDMIELINADVTIDNGFSFSTDGVVSIYADNASLTASSFAVSANNFIHDPLRPFPASVGTISADSFDFTTLQDLIIDAHLISTGSLNLFAPGLIDIEDTTSGGDLTLLAGSTIDGRTQTAAGLVSASAPGNITLGNVVAGESIDIFSSGGDLALGFLSAGTFIDLEAAGNIGFGDATADTLDFEAGGTVTGGDILAATFVTGEAGGAVLLGDISVGIQQAGGPTDDGFAVGIISATSITVGDVEADEAIGFATFGDLLAGNLDSGTGVMTLIGGDTAIASITTPGGGQVYHGDAQMFIDAGGPDDFNPAEVLSQPPVQSGGSYTVTGAISTGQLQVAAAAIATGDIVASNSATLEAAGTVATGAIDAGLLAITAGTDIATGDIFAFDGVTMDAGGSILAGDIDAGSIDLLAGADITTGYLNTQLIGQLDGGFTALLFPGASITLEAGGDIATGAISSIDGVFLNAGGSILTGTIDAFDFVEAHASGDIETDDIDAGDYVLLDAGGALTTAAVNGSDIDASAGGTATVGGTWSAGNVQIVSNDLDITANGSVGAGGISLISTNATQTVVGDGVGGGGYQLSDAEFDRLSSSSIDVIADAALGAAPLMRIGDLSVDASGGDGGTAYEFATFDSESESVTGSIRILGEALFTGMGVDDGVTFTTNRFELDAATGLLSLENGPGTLGGTLFLDAAHIHVASGEILDQLADDPQYEGYQDDLNAPAAVQRPDGVIRAGGIEIEFADAGEAELNTLYVQNTGSEETPAGFVINGASLFGEGNEVTPPPGSIDLVINGQIVTEGGTLTGVEVRDALVEAEGDITPFTENSTINGCLLAGPCGVVVPPEPPFPPGFTPTPGIQDEVELVDDGLLPPPDFGNEDFIDDNIETTTDGATSPITPPSPLFDSSALGGKGDVDDPVSGSGNPALMEKGLGGEAACPTGSAQPAGQCKEEKQP
jgi:filamentous hemagglutinin family protein